MNNFKELVFKAQNGDQESIYELIADYTPLIERYSYLSGKRDEDLHSELLLAFIKCIRNFKLNTESLESWDYKKPNQMS